MKVVFLFHYRHARVIGMLVSGDLSPTGLALLDSGGRVRQAASDLRSACWQVFATSCDVHRDWQGLRAAYEAPEAPQSWAAMDRPQDELKTCWSRRRWRRTRCSTMPTA